MTEDRTAAPVLAETEAETGTETPPRRTARLLAVVAAAAAVATVAVVGTVVLRDEGAQPTTTLATLLSGTQEQRSAHVRVTASGVGQGQTMEGYVDFAADRSSFVSTEAGTGSRSETRSIGTDSWTTGMPGMLLPAGKKWLHLPHRANTLSLSADPQELLASLAKSGGTATGPDERVVDGERLRHYAVSGLRGGTTVDVYLGEDDLVRRVDTSARMPGGAVLTFRLDVLAYSDEPVQVEVPPVAEVVEYDDLGKLGIRP